jgi:hypothetical protein
LLAEGEVLENQIVMSAASQRDGADEEADDLQHALILVVLPPAKQRSCARF